MEEILNFLNSFYELSPACLERLRAVVQKRNVKKGEILLKPGQVCTNLYFIKKGLLRCYYIQNKKVLTDWFFWENDAVVSVDSWYDQLPSEEYIDALEDCELYYISYSDLENIYLKHVEFNYVGRVLTTKYLRVWHRLAKVIRLQLTAERYQWLLENRPDMLERVPLANIATWLGMTPELMSRARSKGN